MLYAAAVVDTILYGTAPAASKKGSVRIDSSKRVAIYNISMFYFLIMIHIVKKFKEIK